MHSHPAAAANLQKRTITFDGESRVYYLYVPKQLADRKTSPAVVVLHGGMGNGRRVSHQSQMPRFADKLGFIAIFPDAGGRQWNDGRESTRGTGDDVGYINAVVESLEAQKLVDHARVFVAGVSNGGMMAQRLACESHRFAAFATIVANLPADLAERCEAVPTPFVFFMGTDDPIMPYGGGQITSGERGAGSGGTVVSAERTVDFWADASGCKEKSTTALPKLVDDGTKVFRHDFSSCQGNIVFYEVQGGGHNWPGHGEDKETTGVVSNNIDATEVLLDFFEGLGL